MCPFFFSQGAEDVRADQLPEVAVALASDDAFILQTPETVYVWQGTVSFTHQFLIQQHRMTNLGILKIRIVCICFFFFK